MRRSALLFLALFAFIPRPIRARGSAAEMRRLCKKHKLKCPIPMTGTAPGDDAPPRAAGVEPAAMRGATAAHNRARASVQPPAPVPLPKLIWDNDLQRLAQHWADRCVFEHSHGATGENLFAGTADHYEPAFVVDDWVSEKKDYHFAGNSCDGACGHYTQVVWANSRRVGCAMQTCTKHSPFGASTGAWQLWVCEYDPPGNYVGQWPYGH